MVLTGSCQIACRRGTQERSRKRGRERETMEDDESRLSRNHLDPKRWRVSRTLYEVNACVCLFGAKKFGKVYFCDVHERIERARYLPTTTLTRRMLGRFDQMEQHTHTHTSMFVRNSREEAYRDIWAQGKSDLFMMDRDGLGSKNVQPGNLGRRGHRCKKDTMGTRDWIMNHPLFFPFS